jgi:single-stranded-DNA-specific exonuclease
VDLETVAFVIAPRLNAAGRVGEAVEAARLLLAEDPDEAAALAASLDASNLTRRDITKQVLADARLALVDGRSQAQTTTQTPPRSSPRAPAVIADPLVAVDRQSRRSAGRGGDGRPAVVGARLGHRPGIVPRRRRIDLAAALDACGDLLHPPRPPGSGRIRDRRRPLGRLPEAVPRWPAGRAVTPARRSASISRCRLAIGPRPRAELGRLAPTGPGNPDPLIGILGLTVARVRPANGGHTQLMLRRERDVLDAIAFGRDDLASVLSEGDRVDVVARIVSRRFSGIESLQLEVRDIGPSAGQP